MSFVKNIFNTLFQSELNTKEEKIIITKIDFDENKVQVITMPKIEDSSFKISKWFFKVGSTIQKNSIICHLESDAITIEIESLVSGKLVEITTQKEWIQDGEEICKIEKF
jgi:hypothetical protein